MAAISTLVDVNGKEEQVVSSGSYVVLAKLATLGNSTTEPTVVQEGAIVLTNNAIGVNWKTETSEASKATYGGDLTVTQVSNGKVDITFADMLFKVIAYLWPDTKVTDSKDLLAIDASTVPAAHVFLSLYDNLADGSKRVMKFMDIEIPFAGLASKAMSGKSASQVDDVTVSCTVNKCEYPYGKINGAVYVKKANYTAKQLKDYLTTIDPTTDAKLEG